MTHIACSPSLLRTATCTPMLQFFNLKLNVNVLVDITLVCEQKFPAEIHKLILQPTLDVLSSKQSLDNNKVFTHFSDFFSLILCYSSFIDQKIFNNKQYTFFSSLVFIQFFPAEDSFKIYIAKHDVARQISIKVLHIFNSQKC